jgi:hypothetical protein
LHHGQPAGTGEGEGEKGLEMLDSSPHDHVFLGHQAALGKTSPLRARTPDDDDVFLYFTSQWHAEAYFHATALPKHWVASRASRYELIGLLWSASKAGCELVAFDPDRDGAELVEIEDWLAAAEDLCPHWFIRP